MRAATLFKGAFLLSVVAVFLGNVRLPQTVPVSILISLVFVLRIAWLRLTLPVILLLCVLVSGLFNLMLAGYVNIEHDWVIYLPLLYALFVLSFVGGFSYDKTFQYALFLGAFILCMRIVFAIPWSLEDGAEYYALKVYIETPLGRSNYLAVFLGFALLISTFWLRWAFVPLAMALLLTLSRTGIVLMMAFLLLRLLHSRRYWIVAVITAMAMAGIFYTYAEQISGFLDYTLHGVLSADSIDVRVRAWFATLEIVGRNPWFGVPRSCYKGALELAVPGENLWDPHNSVLHILVSFGVVGLLFYGAYIAYVFREIYRAGTTDLFWRGVCWGYSLVLVWSLFEPILLTPAIEILQAQLFIMARAYTRTKCDNRLESAGTIYRSLPPGTTHGAT